MWKRRLYGRRQRCATGLRRACSTTETHVARSIMCRMVVEPPSHYRPTAIDRSLEGTPCRGGEPGERDQPATIRHDCLYLMAAMKQLTTVVPAELRQACLYLMAAMKQLTTYHSTTTDTEHFYTGSNGCHGTVYNHHHPSPPPLPPLADPKRKSL